MSPINVLIYEDNDMLRESISGVVSLHDGLVLKGAFSQVTDIDRDIETYQPQLILMDIEMPGMTGIQAIDQIRKAGIDIPVIVLTVFEDAENVLQAIQAGASGYLLKKHIFSKLYQSIEEVMEGGAPMSPTVARMVIDSMQKNVTNQYNLTSREKETLAELSKGNSYKMIAAQFEISIDTVRTHIKKIYDKLQVHSQTEAVSKAINEKLV